MPDTFSSQYPNIAQLLDDGCELEVHSGGYGMQITSIYDGEQLVCMFLSNGDKTDSVFSHLEEMAELFVSEGIVTDEVNDNEYCIW